MLLSHKDTVEEFWTRQVIDSCRVKANNNSIIEFSNLFAQYLDVDVSRLSFTSSGRFALEWILKSIKTEKKQFVLAAAFNCSVVADAIHKSGFKIAPYDFSNEFGRIDEFKLEQLLNENVGAIIISHFFGVPVDFRRIIEKCHEKKIFIIEDCAHTLGGKIGQLKAGTLGDASIFSFNYDKPISLGWGGALLVNNPSLVDSLSKVSIKIPSRDCEFEQLVEFQRVMKVRRLNIPTNDRIWSKLLRKLRVKKAVSFNLPSVGIGGLRAELGIWQLKRYPEILQIRHKNSKYIIESKGEYTTWWVGSGIQPAWLKQKILPNRLNSGTLISKNLKNKGLRVGNYNWKKLIGVNGGLFPNADKVANFGIDIPIHQNMGKENLELIVNTIRNCQ